MRLAVVADGMKYPPDEGTKNTALALVSHLHRLGIPLLILSNSPEALVRGAMQLPSNRLLLGGRSFRQRLTDFGPDALVYFPRSAATLSSFLRAWLLRRQSGARFIAMLAIQARTYHDLASKLSLQRSVDLVFSQSRDSEAALKRLGLKTAWLPNGVDMTRFCPPSPSRKEALRRKYGIAQDAKIVLHVGHLNEHRNVLLLRRLAANGFHVIMVASTSTFRSAHLGESLRQAGVLIMGSYMEHIEEIYQLADCYVFPSRYRTSAIDVPLSVLEAMACNLPVVTTPFGGLPAMFAAGSGYYFLESDDLLLPTVDQALKEVPETRRLVSPFSWDAAARMLLSSIQEGLNETANR